MTLRGRRSSRSVVDLPSRIGDLDGDALGELRVLAKGASPGGDAEPEGEISGATLLDGP